MRAAAGSIHLPGSGQHEREPDAIGEDRIDVLTRIQPEPCQAELTI